MATLTPSITSGSVSSLIKSASSLASANQTFADNEAAYQFSQDVVGDPDGALQTYEDYLSGRIDNLSALGGPTNGSKAISLSNTLNSARSKSTSVAIANENIQVMAGNATPTDKYNLIASEFQRAQAAGDPQLAQSLESQGYSLYQTIQDQNQQAEAAAKTLQEASVTHEGDIETSLNNSIKQLGTAAKGQTEEQFNKASLAFAQSPGNVAALKSLGVVLPKGAAPNFFDIVAGIAGAKYNHLVLKAQAEYPLDPLKASNDAQDAANLASGQTKIDTGIAGSLSIQEIQEAAQSPNMFAYDGTSGTYKKTTETGYQTQSFTRPDGSTYQAVVPTYSGYASGSVASKFYFLTPTETAQIKSLGLDIDAKLNADGTVGAGVSVQATNSTPPWLAKIIGQKGVEQVFNQQGQLSFKAGDAYYTVITDRNGIPGAIKHNADGTSELDQTGYGFNHADAALRLDSGSQTDLNALKNSSSSLKSSNFSTDTLNILMGRASALQIATAKAAQAMISLPPPPLPNISLAPPPVAPAISVPTTTPVAKTVAPTTVNPQTQKTPNLGVPTAGVQGGGGVNLNSGGTIKI